MNRLIALTLACVSLTKAYPVSGQGKDASGKQERFSIFVAIRLKQVSLEAPPRRSTTPFMLSTRATPFTNAKHKEGSSFPASVTLSSPIQFAIEDDRIYIKGADGSGRETKTIKETYKLRVKN